MAYDTENLKNNRGGATTEVSDKPATPAGLYRHPQTGQELITLYDPLYGDVQSEGLVRVGFEYVGEAPEGSIKSIVEQIIDTKSSEAKDLSSMASRLAALEGVRNENTAKEAELNELRRYKEQKEKEEAVKGATQGSAGGEGNDVLAGSSEAAKKAAEEQTEARGTDNSGQVETSGGVNSTPATTSADADQEQATEKPEKPFSQLNREELVELAEKEGVELTEEENTNDKIRAKIKEARESKEG